MTKGKTPFILVTGFLGSGKTTLLKNLLSLYSLELKIAVIQNEFAESGVDGKELKNGKWRFSLLEINTGSVFCVCLFAGFREHLRELIDSSRPDVVILEATGIADPIAICELLGSEELKERVWLREICTVVDASTFLRSTKIVQAVNNQIKVADTVIINKCDMADSDTISKIKDRIYEINCYARVVEASHCDTDAINLIRNPYQKQSVVEQHAITGCPSKRDNDIISDVFRYNREVSMSTLNDFLFSLPKDLLRLKGYVLTEGGKAAMVQFIQGAISVTECERFSMITELTNIGYCNVDYGLLKGSS